jgi:hypothetical protein
MPGRRPVDINQQTHDRGNLKGSVTALPDSAYALKSAGLNQFGSTSSEQLAQVITDETGTGTLVFNNGPVLNTIYIDTTSKIVTANLLTGSTTIVPIMQFPLYEGNLLTNDYDVIGSIEFTVQTEVGDTTGTALPGKLTKRKITKILAAFNHDYETPGETQNPTVNFVEYGNTYTSASDFAVYSVVYDSTDKIFELRVAPLLTNTMYHRVVALCTVGIDKIWSEGNLAQP